MLKETICQTQITHTTWNLTPNTDFRKEKNFAHDAKFVSEVSRDDIGECNIQSTILGQCGAKQKNRTPDQEWVAKMNNFRMVLHS